MARLARLSIAGCVHHVVQRAVDRREIFREEADFRRMLADLGESCRRHGVALHAYVLMPDHFHLLATPSQAESLSRVMQGVGRRYVRWFNERRGRSGTLWEGRFRSTVLDPATVLLDCMRLIELHPARSGLLEDAAAYPWSSLGHHLGRRVDPLITDPAAYWALGNTPFERQAAYARLCASPLDAAVAERILAATQRGWPLGPEEFIRRLQESTARPLQKRPVGRPRRTAPAADTQAGGGAPERQ